jgi:hypothetical protein
MKLFLLTLVSSLALLGSTGRSFEENRGQAGVAGADVQFLARDRGRQVFFTSREVLWAPADGPAIRLRFPGATGPAQWQASRAPIGHISYAIGNDRSQWVNQARQFDRIIWRGAYPGIDIVFYWQNDRLEYDFLVAPGADPARIRIAWSGAPARLASDGSITVAGGLIQQLPPVAYQGSRKIPGRFLASGQQFRLQLGPYNRTQPLTIDPVLELSTYLGGENDDAVTTITADLIAGTTASIQFPGATPDSRRSRDIFVRGLGNPAAGNQFIGTYVFGGSGDDELGAAIYLTGRRTLVIGGTTRSADFPSTSQDSQTLAGPSDGFLAEFQLLSQFGGLSPSSVRLIGGSGEDRIHTVVGESSWYIYAGETNSPDLPNATNTHSGGFDGFYGHTLYPTILQYLGGKEDDRILAIGFTFTNNVTLAGETRSSDFPHQQPDAPALQGASDAFLANVIFPPFNSGSTEVRVSSWLVGGSGEDRITALTTRLTIPSVAFAGVTTSPNLPVRNAAQPEFAGETDAFAGVSRQGTIEWLTYLGGSSVDEATGIARNSVGDLFLTGWTRSTDLKTVIPFQEQPGGGEDAFYAIVSPGAIRTLTYFGGAGDDRASALWLVKDGVARLGGWTKSTNLPVKNEWQNGRGQGSEGFLAEIGSSYLYSVSQVALAKDGAVLIPARVPQSAVGQQITYRSSDPSKVRLNTGYSSGEEVTAPSITSVFAEALSDSGEVDITISSPGFTSTVCRVKLYPGALITSMSATSLLIWSRPVAISNFWAPLDPETGRPIVSTPETPISFNTRAGFRLPPLTWTSSDDRVLQINRSAGPFEFAEAIAVAPGEALLQTQAGGLPVWPQGGLPVTVSGFTATIPGTLTLGKNLQLNLPFSLDPGANTQRPGSGALSARSEDPSRLLVSLDPNQLGTGSVSGQLVTSSFQRQGIWLQALSDEGEVRVFLNSPEFRQEVVTVVKLEKARLRWGQPGTIAQSTLPVARPTVGGSVFLNLQLESASGGGFSQLRPGAPASLWRLSNSDSSIAEVDRATINVNSDRLSVTGLAPGSATLSLAPIGPSEIELVNPTVGVEVTRPPTNNFVAPPSRVTLGQDLQVSVGFRYTGPAGAVTATSEDPSAVLLALQSSQPGQATVVLTPRSSSPEYTVVLQGLRDSGESTVLIRYPNGEFRMRVIAAPSGLGFRPVSAAQGFDQGYAVQTYWLDAPTGVPIAIQSPRPGQRFEFTLRSSNPELSLSRTSAALDMESNTALVSVTLPPVGQEAELLAESAGRTFRQPLRRPPPVPLASLSTALMRDTVGVVRIAFPPTNSTAERRLRATSRQPESVSLSLSPDAPGTSSVEWTWRSGATFTLYLHGLQDTGTVPVLIEGDGITPTEITTMLLPFRLQWNFGGFFGVGTLALSPNESLTGSVSLGDATLRPGAERRTVRLSSTAANVADISPTSVELTPGRQSWNVTLQTKETGQAGLLLEMDGSANSSPSLAVNVRAPAPLPVSLLTLGANTQLPLPIALAQNPGGAIVTFRSSDPERVVLSRNATALGSGSVSLAIQAGQLSGSVQMQALASQGEVTITATVPGLPEQQWRVRLTPSWLTPRLSSSSLAVGDRAEVSAVVEPASPTGPTLLRPGLGDLNLEVVSSPPSLVRLAAPSLRLLETGGGSLALEAIAPGETTLRFAQPPGFGPPPDGSGVLRLRIAARRLSIGCLSDRALALGRDTQLTCPLGGAPEGTLIEAVSSDPALLLLSSDPLTVGAGRQSFRFTAQSGLTLQALRASGTAEVTLSAPGFEDLRLTVVLRRSEVRVNTQAITLARGATQVVRLDLAIPESNGFGYRGAAARAGSTILVQANFNPPGIVSAQTATVTIAPNSRQGELTIRGDTAGATLLQLTSPGGFVNPDSPPVPILVQ